MSLIKFLDTLERGIRYLKSKLVNKNDKNSTSQNVNLQARYNKLNSQQLNIDQVRDRSTDLNICSNATKNYNRSENLEQLKTLELSTVLNKDLNVKSLADKQILTKYKAENEELKLLKVLELSTVLNKVLNVKCEQSIVIKHTSISNDNKIIETQKTENEDLKLETINDLKLLLLRVSFRKGGSYIEPELNVEKPHSPSVTYITKQPLLELSLRELCIINNLDKESKFFIKLDLFNLYVEEYKKNSRSEITNETLVGKRIIEKLSISENERKEATYIAQNLGRSLKVIEISKCFYRDNSDLVINELINLLAYERFGDDFDIITNSTAIPARFLRNFSCYFDIKEASHIYSELERFSQITNLNDKYIRKKRSDFLNEIIKQYRYRDHTGNGYVKGSTGRYYKNDYNLYIYHPNDFT